MESKILLVGKDRRYYFAEKDYENKTLKHTEKTVPATDLIRYGFDFKFGGMNNVRFRDFGYTHPENTGLSDEEVAKKNLDLTVEGLEKIVEEKKADFMLVDKIKSRNRGTCWHIEGRAILLISK